MKYTIIPNDEKVFMVSKSTNTIYSGSAALKAMNEWYTMGDVVNTVRPYQVFTALLTQSGGDNILLGSAFPLTIGVTYFIDDNVGGADFTNVGAPNNNIGTYFIATGTTPTSWGDGTLEYNTGAPIATVLENTIGNVWLTYVEVGSYRIDLDIIRGLNTTFFISNNTDSAALDPTPIINAKTVSPTAYLVCSYTAEAFPSDDILYNTPIEIRVYN